MERPEITSPFLSLIIKLDVYDVRVVGAKIVKRIIDKHNVPHIFINYCNII